MNVNYQLSEKDFSGPVAIIRVNTLYFDGISDAELLDITRCYWNRNRAKAEQCELVLSAYRGEVKGVYIAEKWVDGRLIKVDPKLNPPRPHDPGFGFVGHRAPDSIRNKYIGCSVRGLFRKGDQCPLRVFNLPKV